MTGDSFEWNDKAVQSLRRFWAEGHPTAEIGRRIGVSKNAVVGKAHRLDLPGRPSPIAKESVPSTRPPKPTSRIVPQLPDILPVAITTPRPAPARIPVTVSVTAPGTNVIPVKPAVESIPPELAETSRSIGSRPGRTCCWPIGEPGTKTFRFCDLAIESRSSYCPDHARKAYVRRPETSQDAASDAR